MSPNRTSFCDGRVEQGCRRGRKTSWTSMKVRMSVSTYTPSTQGDWRLSTGFWGELREMTASPRGRWRNNPGNNIGFSNDPMRFNIYAWLTWGNKTRPSVSHLKKSCWLEAAPHRRQRTVSIQHYELLTIIS